MSCSNWLGGVLALLLIEDVPLVPEEATGVRVDLMTSAPTAATQTITFGSSNKSMAVRLAQGPNTRYVPVDPSGAPIPTGEEARHRSGF